MKYLFYLILILSTFLKIAPALDQKMPFTMDQGRDLIDIRQIWEQHDLRLTGPTTSINGVYLGPFYYYLISIPYLLTSGSPLSILIWQIILFQSAVWYLWHILHRESKLLSFVVAISLLISPIGFHTARYFWNANFMPIFTILFLAFLHQSINSHNSKKDFFLGIIAGLSLQIEAAFGILFLPFSILIFKQKKVAKTRYFKLVLGFLITLIPQAIFEIKNHFIMSNVLFGELSGKTSILGAKVSFYDRLSERADILGVVIRETSQISYKPFVCVLALCFLYYTIKLLAIKKNKDKNMVTISHLSLGLLFFSAIFYILYPSQVKAWYVYGITTSLVIFLAATLSKMLLENNVTFILSLTILVVSTFCGIRSQFEYLMINQSTESNDPSGYINQLRVIDDVYKNANNMSFRVYNYIPSVYDYPFQYLFWWYGLRKYGYSPNDLAYLPDQPEYITNKNTFLKNLKTETDRTKIYLIIQEGENKKHFYEWLGNFTHLCTDSVKEYPFGQRLIKLQKCP